MKNSGKIFYGLLITILIYICSVIGGYLTKSLTNDFVLAYMMVPLLSFVLSAIAIYGFVSNGVMEFKLTGIKLKYVVLPIIITLVATFLTGALVRIIETLLGLTFPEKNHVSFMTPVQIFFYIFLFGSIAEELLFRGFLQNMLVPLKASGIRLFKMRLSLPVIIGAFLFGFAHFSLLQGMDDLPKISGVVINAIVMGLIAGYYQEKHNNFLFAAIVHLSANFPIVIMAFLS